MDFFQVATYPSVCSNLPKCEESWNIFNYKTAILFECVFGMFFLHKREQKDFS